MTTEEAVATEEQINAAVLYVLTIDAMYDDAYERSEFLSEDYYQSQLALARLATNSNPEDAPGLVRPKG